jgi:hypothetical protein
MKFWNEYDVEQALRRATNPDRPTRLRGILVVLRLMNWTNANSDGWAYWPKPVRAANRLMELLDSGDRWEPEDVEPKDLRKACAPIKAFLTRQGVDHDIIFRESSV